MPRILGIDIPGSKRIEISLRYIYGIGPVRARRVLDEAGIDYSIRAEKLSDQQINEVIRAIRNNGFLIEGDLRRDIQQNLKRLQNINCYRGQRHRKSLPVRGQRTRSSFRTSKSVGVQRKKILQAAKPAAKPKEDKK